MVVTFWLFILIGKALVKSSLRHDDDYSEKKHIVQKRELQQQTHTVYEVDYQGRFKYGYSGFCIGQATTTIQLSCGGAGLSDENADDGFMGEIELLGTSNDALISCQPVSFTHWSVW